jgi:cytoskeletal protein CcmA (bactofilin family)
LPHVKIYPKHSRCLIDTGEGLSIPFSRGSDQVMRDVRINPVDENEIDTILAEDIDFSGVLTFKKPLMIKGNFKGEIKASSDLYIGEKAFVKAKVEANCVSNRGRIEGDVVARSRVEFFATATMEGDLLTPDLVMESGCQYNGKCTMKGKHEK